MKIQVRKFNEYSIPKNIIHQIFELLDSSFPETFEGRNFFKQKPHFRILVFDQKKVVGHMGVDHRAIKIGGEIFYIFGVIDLCVSENYKNKGIGTNLLRTLDGLALKSSVDFIILMADNEDIYVKNGFQHVSNGLTTWLAIEDVKSHSLITRDLSHCFMYKSVNRKEWPGSEIDMLGYLF